MYIVQQHDMTRDKVTGSLHRIGLFQGHIKCQTSSTDIDAIESKNKRQSFAETNFIVFSSFHLHCFLLLKLQNEIVCASLWMTAEILNDLVKITFKAV